MLSLSLPISLLSFLKIDLLSLLGAFFLLLTGIATALVGIFPMDKKRKSHAFVSVMAFACVLFTGVTFAGIFHQGRLFSPLMQFMNFGVIGLTLLLTLSTLVRKGTSSFFEWLSFLGTIAWNFLLSALLLIRI